MFTIFMNILFSGLIIGITICLALLCVLLDVPAVSAFLILGGSLLSYMVVGYMRTLAKNIEDSLPSEEDMPPPH